MSCPLCPRDSQLQQEVSSRQEQYIDELSMLRKSRISAEADTAGAWNTRTVLPFGLSFKKLGSTSVVQEKTHCLPKLAEDQRGNKWLPPRHRNRESENDDGKQIDPLKLKWDVVLSIVNVVNGHELTDTVKLKVQLQGSQCLTSQSQNRILETIKRKQTCILKSQFVDVSFIVRVVVKSGHILFVTVNQKDGFLVRLVAVRSLHQFSCRFSNYWRQICEQLTNFCIDLPVCRVNKSMCSGGQEASKTLLCIKEICKDYSILDLSAYSVNKFIRTGKKEDSLKQSCFADIGKGDCIPDTFTDRLEEARCFRLVTYWKTILLKILKSCKVLLHKTGIVVICLLLVLGAISGTQPPSRACSVSSHLEGIPSESLEVGKGMKLICRHNCSKGTPRWDQDKPRGRELTFNGNVRTQNKQNIELEIIENEYNIIFVNATFADINSTYTCHYGFVKTHISPIDYYKVLPMDKSISKQSVYENNVLNGTLVFEEVYPLPKCVSYCDDKRQKEIPICKTCKIWKRNFYKVKFIFNIDFNYKICREENVSIRCAVGRNHFTYDFSKLSKRKKYNKETTGILTGVIFTVIVLVGLGILYNLGAFKRCRIGRNAEDPDTTELNESKRSPYCVNDSQNNSQEEDTLLADETPSMSESNGSNGKISEQCNLINKISGETSNENRETLNQPIHEQNEMHSDCWTNSDSVAENTITKPVVKNEGTPVQSGHNVVNRCEECNGTGQMPQSPGDVTLPEHYAKRKLEDQYTTAIGSELNDTKSTKENSLENTNVKASEQMSISDVPNCYEESSFSGDLAGINKKRNAEEE